MNVNKLVNSTIKQTMEIENIEHFLNDKLKSAINFLGKSFLIGVLSVGTVLAGSNSDNQNISNVMYGISAIGGMAINDYKDVPPECANIKGVNGWQIAGATAAGTLGGQYIGKGNGNKIARIALPIAAGGLIAKKELDRISTECSQIIENNRKKEEEARLKSQQSQYGYSNNNYINNNIPQAPILYQSVDAAGRIGYVTVENSIGLNSLYGNRLGAVNINTDDKIKDAVEKSLLGLKKSHLKLEESSKKYMDIVNGKNKDLKQYRYETNANELEKSRNIVSNMAKDALINFENAYNDYAEKRGIATYILDNAASDNIDLSVYKDTLNLFSPPESIKITYYSAYNQTVPNRYLKNVQK